MRRLVAALIVVLLAFTLVGCGGGGEEEPATDQAATEAPPTTAPVNPDAAPIEDRSIESSETFFPFSSKDATPSAVEQRLNTKQPMLLFFYDSSLQVADDVRDQVDEVVSNNRGAIDLITYDLGKYVSVNESGVVEVEREAITNDENAKQAVRFARVVGVTHLPYIIIVDDQGYQIYWGRGFQDAQLLERQVVRATR